MKGTKGLIALVVAITVLLLGVVVVEGGWWWNAQLDVEGIEVRTQWTVDEGETEGASDDYRALIVVALPKNTDTEIIAQADLEKVVLTSNPSLECKSDGIEAEVTYRVTSPSQPSNGSMVSVTVLADGQYVDSATGQLDETIKLQILIPADEPDCND